MINGFLCLVIIVVLSHTAWVEEDTGPHYPLKRDINVFTTLFSDKDLINEQLHFVSTHIDLVLLVYPFPGYVTTLQAHNPGIVLLFNNLYFAFGGKFWQYNPGKKTVAIELGETYLADGKRVTNIGLTSKRGVILLRTTSLLDTFLMLEELPW